MERSLQDIMTEFLTVLASILAAFAACYPFMRQIAKTHRERDVAAQAEVIKAAMLEQHHHDEHRERLGLLETTLRISENRANSFEHKINNVTMQFTGQIEDIREMHKEQNVKIDKQSDELKKMSDKISDLHLLFITSKNK